MVRNGEKQKTHLSMYNKKRTSFSVSVYAADLMISFYILNIFFNYLWVFLYCNIVIIGMKIKYLKYYNI